MNIIAGTSGFLGSRFVSAPAFKDAFGIPSLRGSAASALGDHANDPGWFMNFSGPNAAQVASAGFSHQKCLHETMSVIKDASVRGYKVLQFSSIHGVTSPETPYGALHRDLIDACETVENVSIVVLPNCFGFDVVDRSQHLLIPQIIRAISAGRKFEIFEQTKRLTFLPVSSLITIMSSYVGDPRKYWEIGVGVKIALCGLPDFIEAILRAGEPKGEYELRTCGLINEVQLIEDFKSEIISLFERL